MSLSLTGRLLLLATAACTLLPLPALAALDQAVMTLASQHKQPLLDTLKELVNIESGSGDREGLDRISLAGVLSSLSIDQRCNTGHVGSGSC